MNEDMVALADNLADYMKPKVDGWTRNRPGLEAATVVSPYANGTMKVVFPFDETELDLPCVGSMQGAGSKAGDKVWVLLPFGDLSNGIVFGTAAFSNL